MLSLSLPVLPSPLSGVKADLPFSDEAAAVSAFSDFVRESAVRYPEWLLQLQDNPPGADEWQHYPLWLQQQLVGVEDEITLMRELRLFRRHMLVRIAWMQTLAQVSTPVSLQQLSVLAETLIVAARDWLWQACCAEWGTPVNATGEPQPLLILGMGKLGGGELNFSSDIDLIFTWPEHGATRGGRRELDNAQFFTRMGQRLIKVLDQPTVDGIVYRVDMRLRPFGDSGPLVLSFAAMEDYYQEQGRDWERYAMVKARVMGDNGDRWCQELQHMLRPFVFRRYIDFSAVQSLRDMKSMIAREVRRRGLVNNIKLGAGGIRETEFIVQVFQLIRGGRERALQQHALLPTLQAIGELNLLPAEQTTTLAAAYLYLRRVENLLQSINDEQTQTLPDDEKNRQRLAWAMAASDWNDFSLQLDAHMAAVRAIFDDLIGEENQNSETDEQSEDWLMLWHQGAAEEDIALLAPQLDQARQQHVVQTLHHFRRDVDKRTIGPRGRQSLDQLMPRLLREVLSRDDAATTLERMVPLLLGIITRSTYLELLMEYPGALKQLIVLCAASPMVASQLARHPLLLDELLDPATLYHPTAPEAYRDELRQYLLRIPSEDEEQQLEALRQFKQAQHLRIAASDIARTLPVMKVSDHLTWLAEAILEQVVQQAWQLMVQRYGRPAHLEDEQGRGFAVIGYGKLGGWELGYSSDLDLVFLHDCPDDVMTVGERSIDGRQFYLRLAQRVMHLFSTRTASGILYDVDARLRPSGAAGMLVSTFAAFDDYQRHEAWTWEHQALVRARLVFGEPALRTRFTALRAGIIALPRNAENLQREVREMREKMYQHLGSKQKGCWDIKTDPGGITDIEFIAQYLVLRNADHSPALTRWSDNVRIFTMLAEGEWLSSTQADELTAAYITLRDALHHLALQALPAEVPLDAFRAEREVVKRCWQHFFV